MIKVAFFSFADIDNFGDILFSHIFSMEMKKRITELEIVFFTPTNFKVEGVNYHAYEKQKIDDDFDALILFGGEVIHLYDHRTWLPIYNKKNQVLETDLPSNVVFDWVDLQKPYKAWISVGVRPISTNQDFFKFQNAIDHLDYISTRGNLSKKILERNNYEYHNPAIEITPDLGWLFPHFLDYKNCRGELYKKFLKFKNEYVVFQINNVTSEEAEKIAEYLLRFQEKYNLEVVLLPVIRPWEDNKYLAEIFNYSKGKFHLMPNNLNILEIADILVHAYIVLCSSLHAAITALASGIPAGIINKWQGTKLQDLFGHQYRLNMVKHNLNEIPVLLDQLIEEKEEGIENLELYALFNSKKLRVVFDNLVGNIISKKENG